MAAEPLKNCNDIVQMTTPYCGCRFGRGGSASGHRPPNRCAPSRRRTACACKPECCKVACVSLVLHFALSIQVAYAVLANLQGSAGRGRRRRQSRRAPAARPRLAATRTAPRRPRGQTGRPWVGKVAGRGAGSAASVAAPPATVCVLPPSKLCFRYLCDSYRLSQQLGASTLDTTSILRYKMMSKCHCAGSGGGAGSGAGSGGNGSGGNGSGSSPDTDAAPPPADGLTHPAVRSLRGRNVSATPTEVRGAFANSIQLLRSTRQWGLALLRVRTLLCLPYDVPISQQVSCILEGKYARRPHKALFTPFSGVQLCCCRTRPTLRTFR